MKILKHSISLLLLFFSSTLLIAQVDTSGGKTTDGGTGIENCTDWWIGECGPTTSIRRSGRVHIGSSEHAIAQAAFQVTGKTYLKGDLYGQNGGGDLIMKAAPANALSGVGSYIHLYGPNGSGNISNVTRGVSPEFKVTHNEGSNYFNNLVVKSNGEMIGRRSLQLNTDNATIPLRVKTEQWGEDLFSVSNKGETFGKSFRVGPSFWHPEWDYFKVQENGKVIVGDAAEASAGYLLSVADGIQTQKVKVCANANSWCDYVFAEDYQLNSLEKVEAHIKMHEHLPNVPSAQEVEENGINVAEMDATLLRQVEELWLHMIAMKKENNALRIELEKMKK